MATLTAPRAKYPKQELVELKDLAASYESVFTHPKLQPGTASCGDSGHGDSVNTNLSESIKSQKMADLLKSAQILGSLRSKNLSKSLTSLRNDNSLKVMKKLSGSLNENLDETPKIYPNLEPKKKEVEKAEKKLEDRKNGKYDMTVIEGLEEIKEDIVEYFKNETGEFKVPKGHTGPLSLQYTLETFTEARSTCWAYEPFKGQPIDGSNNGPAPGPWDIQVPQRAKFQDATMHMEIPHTASVKPCHECGSIGRVRCWRCHGRGRVMCHHCSGSGRETYYEDGHHHHRSCTWCHGSGRNRCHTCFGHGQVPCAICEARGSLKCYIKLTVKWINHLADHIVERTALPDHLIRNVTGEVAFEEELPRVWPINHFPEDSINKASGQLVQQHSGAFQTERILLQRHRVRIIPVNEATYEHKGKTRNFFVYGFEKQVHAADYPDSCCWGCTIM